MKRRGREETEAAAMNHRLEQLAAEGEWSQLGETAESRDRLLQAAPVAMRRELLEAALSSTRRCLDLARAARSESAIRLRELGRHRRAAASYRQHAADASATGTGRPAAAHQPDSRKP